MGEVAFGDLIVLGAIALFIILRYRSVLGEKSGHDVTKPKPKPNGADAEKVVHISGAAIQEEIDTKEAESLADIDDPEISQAIARMKNMDASFTMRDFLVGAKAAYEMVVSAFNQHDRDTLKALLAKEVFESFEREIVQQEEKGHTALTTLVSLEEAEIVEADIKRNKGIITVKFTSEQIQLVRDADKNVVEGSASDIHDIVDEWTFERDMKSRNPNWTIVAT